MSFQSVVLKVEFRVLLQIEKLVTIGFGLAADQQTGCDIIIVHIHIVPLLILTALHKQLHTDTQSKKKIMWAAVWLS